MLFFKPQYHENKAWKKVVIEWNKITYLWFRQSGKLTFNLIRMKFPQKEWDGRKVREENIKFQNYLYKLPYSRE